MGDLQTNYDQACADLRAAQFTAKKINSKDPRMLKLSHASRNFILAYHALKGPADVYADPFDLHAEINRISTMNAGRHANTVFDEGLLDDEETEYISKYLAIDPKLSSLKGMADLLVALEAQADLYTAAERTKQWNYIVTRAATKYGPNALLDEFKRQADEQAKLADVSKSKWDMAARTKRRAFAKVCLFVAGITLISLGIAIAVVSAGAASPIALGVVGIGVGVTMSVFGVPTLALTCKLYLRDSKKNKAQAKYESLKPFYKNADGSDKTALDVGPRPHPTMR